MDLTVIILTFNEEKNISQALEKTVGWAKDVLVLDSFSTDATCEIAARLGAKVFQHSFENYASQRTYALRELPVETEWVFFLDADEYPTEELKAQISDTLSSTEYDGFFIRMRFYFMDKVIRFGGYGNTWILRVFKKDRAVIEREVNEQVRISGKTGYLKGDFIHRDKKGITAWIDKHNRYATMEAEALIDFENQGSACTHYARFSGNPAERKNWIKYRLWNPLMPPLVRPFFYFFYRFVIKLGILDGAAGLVFHFMHGLWYFLLIDVKYLEMKISKKAETK